MKCHARDFILSLTICLAIYRLLLRMEKEIKLAFVICQMLRVSGMALLIVISHVEFLLPSFSPAAADVRPDIVVHGAAPRREVQEQEGQRRG